MNHQKDYADTNYWLDNPHTNVTHNLTQILALQEIVQYYVCKKKNTYLQIPQPHNQLFSLKHV